MFVKHINTKNLPSLSECLTAIENDGALSGRSPTQLKAWVNNEINRRRRPYKQNKGNRNFDERN